jgi:Arc/MetJ-type ribon-helix-helix transcriptional regulator
MTARAKIAVSLPAELVAAARKAVDSGRAASVSGYVESALTAQVERDDTQAWIDALLEDTGGPLTDPDRDRIAALLGW